MFNPGKSCLKYLDFVDSTYKPKETDLICTFHVEPEGISLKIGSRRRKLRGHMDRAHD
jgi:ribulose 1,5-bisphosphate carboxylase large subunit-like protein